MDYTSRVMGDPFSAYAYLRYVKSRWWYCLVACVVAAAVAFAGSNLIGKEYSATAAVLIQPPAGADPRAQVNVSPAYLESLKAYEHLASGNALFSRAVEKFQLRSFAPGAPVESLKRRMLRVSKLRGTRVLTITVTLPNPKQAAEVAAFLASEAVSLSDADNRADGAQTERLRVIDSGAVPERPSSPNVALNVAAATLFALTATLLYLSAAFSLATPQDARRDHSLDLNHGQPTRNTSA